LLSGKEIVCISSLDWGAMWTSKQQIMHRLARANRILYVEEPVTALAPLKVPARWRRWRAVAPRLNNPEPGLWVLTPPPTLPFGNMKPAINRANQAYLARYIRWAMKRLRFGEDPILWTYLPTSAALIDRLFPAVRRVTANAGDGATETGPSRRGPLVVYHCVDEHSAFPGLVSSDVVRAYDDGLTRRADLVITTADNLRRSRETLNPNTHTVLNAVDIEIFSRALDPATPLPSDLAAVPAPRLAVVGLHDSRLDVSALEALAEADPDWHIVLIGPVKAGQVDEARLRRHANVHLLGEKARRELPGYLKGVSVALIPYTANELTRNIFPLKLFEYLAAGLPVVVGGLPELLPYDGMIGVAETPGDYPELVRRAIAEDNSDARTARVALAAENTWDDRVEQISSLVERTLRRRANDDLALIGADPAPDTGAQAEAAPGRSYASVSILGFRLDAATMEQAAGWVLARAAGEAPAARTSMAVSFNPELVMMAQKNKAAAEALTDADLCYPDGIGAVWAARRQNAHLRRAPGNPATDQSLERVPGIDLGQRVLELAAHGGFPVFFLGAAPGVAEEAAACQGLRLPGLRVAGCHDGYFTPTGEEQVVHLIRESGARILLVAMGAPRQEIFLRRHRDELGIPVALGVGGSFDVWAGRVKRAPAWTQRVGIEWLYRLARDPRRVRRQLVLPRYAWRVIRGA
jgi:exopolysaccharide biosynthesis WecB/TagA/CpsF family protein